MIYSNPPSLSSIFSSSCSSTSMCVFAILSGFPFTGFSCLGAIATIGALSGVFGRWFRSFLFITSISSNTLFRSMMYLSFSCLMSVYCSYLRRLSIKFFELVSSSFLTSIGSLIPTKNSSSSI